MKFYIGPWDLCKDQDGRGQDLHFVAFEESKVERLSSPSLCGCISEYVIKFTALFYQKAGRFTLLQPELHFSNFETQVLAKALTVGCHDAKGDGDRISFICWYQLLKLWCSSLQTAPAPTSTWSCRSEALVAMKMNPKVNQTRLGIFFSPSPQLNCFQIPRWKHFNM